MPEDWGLLWFSTAAAALQHTDLVLLGSQVSRAEWLGAALGLWMVVCNARVHPLGWPLAMVSSLLYALVFMDNRLYGQAALQVVFVIMAAWGLWQWVRPHHDASTVPLPRPAPHAVRRHAALATLVLWGLLGTLMARTTDNPAPYADALPTAGSLVATWLLARKFSENWAVWLLVNLSSLLLFAHQGLWLTAALYFVFALMSAWGWWMWVRR